VREERERGGRKRREEEEKERGERKEKKIVTGEIEKSLSLKIWGMRVLMEGSLIRF